MKEFKKMLVTAPDSMIRAFLIPHIEALIDDGWEIEIVCSNYIGGGNTLRNDFDKNIKFYTVSLARSPFKILRNFKGLREIKAIIDSGNYDVIWTHGPVMSVMTRIAAKKVRRQGVQVWYLAHGFHFFSGAPLINWMVYYPIEYIMSMYVDMLMTINEEDYARALKFKARHIKKINGIGLDVKKFRNRILSVDMYRKIRESIGITDEDVMILSVGELKSRKNQQVAIKAIAQCSLNNIHYVVCGDGPDKEKLELLASNLNIKKKVHFLGIRKDIPDLCKVADIFIHPSIREGLGIAPLEAMASGLPLINSTVGGIKDYTCNGKTGFCLSPHDVAGFAKAIRHLCSDKHLRKVIGKYNMEVAMNYRIECAKTTIINTASTLLSEKLGRASH